MPADGLTKALPRQRHEAFVRLLGLTDITTLLSEPQAGGVCQTD